MLFRYQRRDGTVQEIKEWNGLKPADLRAADLSGRVDLWDTARGGYVCVHSRYVSRLIVDPNAPAIEVEVSLAAPAPQFPDKNKLAPPWEMRLRRKPADDRWSVAAEVPWFRHSGKRTGYWDGWLRKDGGNLFEIFKWFPSSELGLEVHAANAEHARLGVFVVNAPGRDGDPPRFGLALALVPEIPGTPRARLDLAHLEITRLSELQSALVAHLDAGVEGSDGEGSPWFSVFRLRGAVELGPDVLCSAIWNKTYDLGATGLRTTHAGRPWWPLPRLEAKRADQYEANKRWQTSVFAIPTRRGVQPRLVRMGYERTAADSAPIEADFRWYADDAVAAIDRAPLFPRSVRLKGGLLLPQAGPAPDPDEPAFGQYTCESINALVLHGADRTLMEWRIDFASVAAPRTGWLTFGSIDIRVKDPPRDAKMRPSLICRLRGSWDAARCDVHPEIDFRNLPCSFRMANSGDPAPQSLVAQFDVAGREDVLHRPTRPMVQPIDKGEHDAILDGALDGALGLRIRADAHRDAVVQVRLRRDTFLASAGNALYLQTRPFNFARLRPANFDEEAGLDFAYWRSDDPEGAQWRIPDATVEFDLPPQTVAEEMERGNRFWPDTKPYIDPLRPIRYRFAPPTRLKVRPSKVERRYNKNANNLSDILDGGRVEAFSTELLYPIALKFEADSNGEPQIDIAETGSFIGQPTANLPVLARGEDDARSGAQALAQDVFPPDLAEWFVRKTRPNEPPPARFADEYDTLRWTHSANRAQFVARVAQFHVHDPYLRNRQLMLSDGLRAGLRRPERSSDPRQPVGPAGSMPPLLNPLPSGSDVEPQDKPTIQEFLTPTGDWVREQRDSSILTNEHGALRAGALHTVEFPSELVALLRAPGAVSGLIEKLSFSTLGAGGASAISFDEGRTTFSVEISDGQVWRIRKIRLGRIALLWNKAKHVVVYERTVVPSAQFEEQQPGTETFGWPILRKTEEYVEPIEMLRVFAEEADADEMGAGFAHASEFITPRIYVDGAWGRDLKHGYEIPLWNPADTSGFYPKPLAAISAHAGDGGQSRAWHEHPEELYFYSNTQQGAGADSNAWPPFSGVDLVATGVTRLPQLTNRGLGTDRVLEATTLASPRPGGMRRKRFDLLVRSDGPVDLQHQRGDSQLLAAGVDMLSFGRTSARSPMTFDAKSEAGAALAKVEKLNDYAGKVDSLRDQAQRFVDDLPALYFKYRLAGCDVLAEKLSGEASKFFEDLRERAGGVFADVPQVELDLDAGILKKRLREELLERSLPPLVTFRAVVKEMREQLEVVAQYTKELETQTRRDQIREHLDALYVVGRQIIASANKKLEDALVQPMESAASELAQLASLLEQLKQPIAEMLEATGEEFKKKAGDVKALADQIVAAIRKLRTPQLASVLQPVEMTAGAISQLAAECAGIAETLIKDLVPKIKGLLTAVADEVGKLGGSLVELAQATSRAAVEALYDAFEKTTDRIDPLLTNAWGDAQTAAKNIKALLELFKKGLSDSAAQIEVAYQAWRDGVLALVDKPVNCAGVQKPLIDCLCGRVNGLTRPVTQLCGDFRSALIEHAKQLSPALAEIESATLAAIDKLKGACSTGQAAMDEQFAKVAAQARGFVARLEQTVTKSLTSIVDEATVQRMAAWGKEFSGYQELAGKSLKLAKAIGSLPELPHLTFNADRVEYVFDDIKKEIETSPFAAKVREIDSGLKELGLAVPVRKLLDQLVPDEAPVDFNKVFRDFGGIDFRKLFAKFRLPGIDKDHIKVTHGIDKPTRSAWIKAKVATSYPQPQDLFAAGPLVVRTAALSLSAESDVRIQLDGRRSVETSGLLRADWSLEFKGAKLVAFRDTTVTLDGGKFYFNIAPEKVELHPAVRFVSDIAKKLGEKIPPCIEVVRDARGVIVGARANLSTVIKDPPKLGAVVIGPLTIVGGLSLTLEEGHKFAVAGHMSVGTKTAPIFVQINFLGGGLWLDAEARFLDGKITYIGNVGLALGSTEAFNLGGVARGSYTLLLFAYASFKSGGGGSLRAGVSIEGCARVLGIVNAHLLIVLEVVHGEGKARGNGLLDLEIEIGRWYSINVHKQVERSL
jgi:hypothetical protein